MLASLLMEDHGDAYVLWKRHGLSGQTCVHVDAHLDVSPHGFISADLEGMAAGENLERYRVSSYLPWGGFHCGNYLYPALLEGMVTRLVWVVPDWMMGGLDWARAELQNWVELTLPEYASLRLVGGRIEGTLLGRSLTICTLATLPELVEPVLLDVDIDYFLDPDDGLWLTPQQLRERLAGLQVNVLTVACSVLGGYTPPEHRWLGAAVCRAFGVETADLAYAAQAIDRGSLHFRRKDYERALDCFSRVGSTEARYLEGLSLSRAGRAEEASERWEELCASGALGPRAAAYVHFLRARELKKQSRYSEAIAAFEKALAQEPDNASYLHHFGLTLMDGGFLEEAARTLRKALRVAPERLAGLELHLELARLYRALDQPAFAQAELRQLKQKDVTGVYKLKAIMLE